ncbi:MAG: phage tail protein [Quinella sp. 1Q5]|nr:phage tail protein [Quinella sp. 1Q5]
MTYVTVAGDSFDLVAKKTLGSEYFTPKLINANPKFITTFIFQAGVELQIPEIKTAKQSILPWQN